MYGQTTQENRVEEFVRLHPSSDESCWRGKWWWKEHESTGKCCSSVSPLELIRAWELTDAALAGMQLERS
jgi:hypothetical protein